MIDLLDPQRNQLTRICIGNYDKRRSQDLNNGPKAISYALHGKISDIGKKNTKHRITLSRLHLSTNDRKRVKFKTSDRTK